MAFKLKINTQELNTDAHTHTHEKENRFKKKYFRQTQSLTDTDTHKGQMAKTYSQKQQMKNKTEKKRIGLNSVQCSIKIFEGIIKNIHFLLLSKFICHKTT